MDYRLVVVATMFPRALAQRLGFEPDDATVSDGVWTIDARAPLGLELVLFGGKGRMHAHFGADKELPVKAWRSAVRLVERVLATGEEDLTFTAFDRHVVIERVDGVVRRLSGEFVYRDPKSILVDEVGRHPDLLALADAVVGAHSTVEARRVALVLEIAGAPENTLLRMHQRDTEFRWDDDAETWAWFGRFAQRIAHRVDELLAPLEPTTERLVVDAFATHLDDADLWGATLDQLLVAADRAARDLAEAPGARAVAARLRARTEHDDLTFRLRRSSNYPWPELQAVAWRIADRIGALVP